MRIMPVLSLMLLPVMAHAGGLKVENATIPLAPPTAKVHAVYMDLYNHGHGTKALIGVTAEGYAIVHLHQSQEQDGVATMTAVDQIDIAPQQLVKLSPGGLHIMLMRPAEPTAEGDAVELTLQFADGSTLPVTAIVAKHVHSGHSHEAQTHSTHDHGS